MRMSARCLAAKTGDFITAVDEKNIIVVKEAGDAGGLFRSMERIASRFWRR